MLAIDWLKANAKGPYTVEPITMVKDVDDKPCLDYRPGDHYQRAVDRPLDNGCGQPHLKVQRCGKVTATKGRNKHTHTSACYQWAHCNVAVDGWLFTDGKFVAKGYADAEMPKGNEWKSRVPAFRKPKFCQQADIDVAAIKALASLDGIECTTVLDTEGWSIVGSAQEAL